MGSLSVFLSQSQPTQEASWFSWPLYLAKKKKAVWPLCSVIDSNEAGKWLFMPATQLTSDLGNSYLLGSNHPISIFFFKAVTFSPGSGCGRWCPVIHGGPADVGFDTKKKDNNPWDHRMNSSGIKMKNTQLMINITWRQGWVGRM